MTEVNEVRNGQDRRHQRDSLEEAGQRATEEGSETSGLPSEAGLSPGAGNTPDSTTHVDSSRVHDEIPVHRGAGAELAGLVADHDDSD